jgi:hypothetical protein
LEGGEGKVLDGSATSVGLFHIFWLLLFIFVYPFLALDVCEKIIFMLNLVLD